MSGRRGAGLVWELALRDLRVRYRRSVLGVLWAQVAPLSQVAVLTIVFTRVVPLDIDDYPVFVLLGILPWTWCHSALVTGTAAVVDARDLLRHPGFPRVAVPIVSVTSALVHHLLVLPIAVVAAVVVTGRLTPSALAVVALLAVQFVLLLGPVFILASIHVRFRDTAHLVGVLMVPLFYVTPVFYEVSALDAAPILRANPMVPIVDGYRDALLHGEWPSAAPLAAVALAGLLLLGLGVSVYRARMGAFLEDV